MPSGNAITKQGTVLKSELSETDNRRSLAAVATPLSGPAIGLLFSVLPPVWPLVAFKHTPFAPMNTALHHRHSGR